MNQDILNLVSLLDLDAYAHRVDGRLDQDALVLVPGDGQRGEEDLGRAARLDLGDIVALGDLGGEIGEVQRGGHAGSDCGQVRAEGLRL